MQQIALTKTLVLEQGYEYHRCRWPWMHSLLLVCAGLISMAGFLFFTVPAFIFLVFAVAIQGIIPVEASVKWLCVAVGMGQCVFAGLTMFLLPWRCQRLRRTSSGAETYY
jgi:hypothetical protein